MSAPDETTRGACTACGAELNAAGYCTNKQCSRHGRRNDYLEGCASSSVTATSPALSVDELNAAQKRDVEVLRTAMNADGPIVCLRRWDPVLRQMVFEPLPEFSATATEAATLDPDVEFLRNYAAALYRRAREARAAGQILGPECVDVQGPIFERIADRLAVPRAVTATTEGSADVEAIWHEIVEWGNASTLDYEAECEAKIRRMLAALLAERERDDSESLYAESVRVYDILVDLDGETQHESVSAHLTALAAEVRTLRAEREQMLAAYAVIDVNLHEAFDAWDADNDSRCGKLLAALSGVSRSYRPDVTEARAAFIVDGVSAPLPSTPTDPEGSQGGPE